MPPPYQPPSSVSLQKRPPQSVFEYEKINIVKSLHRSKYFCKSKEEKNYDYELV